MITFSKFSADSKDIIYFVIRALSPLKYGYRDIIEGCIDSAIKNYGHNDPGIKERQKIVLFIIKKNEKFSH